MEVEGQRLAVQMKRKSRPPSEKSTAVEPSEGFPTVLQLFERRIGQRRRRNRIFHFGRSQHAGRVLTGVESYGRIFQRPARRGVSKTTIIIFELPHQREVWTRLLVFLPQIKSALSVILTFAHPPSNCVHWGQARWPPWCRTTIAESQRLFQHEVLLQLSCSFKLPIFPCNGNRAKHQAPAANESCACRGIFWLGLLQSTTTAS